MHTDKDKHTHHTQQWCAVQKQGSDAPLSLSACCMLPAWPPGEDVKDEAKPGLLCVKCPAQRGNQMRVIPSKMMERATDWIQLDVCMAGPLCNSLLDHN